MCILEITLWFTLYVFCRGFFFFFFLSADLGRYERSDVLKVDAYNTCSSLCRLQNSSKWHSGSQNLIVSKICPR